MKPDRRLASLWDQALPPEAIPAYPKIELLHAHGGETTWEWDVLHKVSRPRPAEPGELVRDADLKYIPDPTENLLYRIKVNERARRDAAYAGLQREICKSSITYFVNVFGWTFDPRRVQSGLDPDLPFVTFPFQDEYLEWRLWTLKHQMTGVTEKSRDVGVSWLNMSANCYLINFFPGSVAYLTALREEDVCNKGVDSLFGKVRFFQARLPAWLRNGWEQGSRDDIHMYLSIPDMNSAVRGQKVDSTSGRSGRATVVDADEFAHVQGGAEAQTAFMSIAPSVFYTSTPKGMDNAFARIAHEPGVNKKTLHWRRHPLKNDEWAAKERLKGYTDETWAQEQEIQYEKSTTARVFPQFVSFDEPQVPWCHIQTGSYFQYDPAYDVYTGQDYGMGDPTAIVFMQIKPCVPEFSVNIRDCPFPGMMFLFFDMLEEPGGFGAWEVRHALWGRGYRYRQHVGDMRTGHQRDSAGSTWIKNLRKVAVAPMWSEFYRRSIDVGLPILVDGNRAPLNDVLTCVETALQTPGRLAINPEKCGPLVQGFQNWSYPTQLAPDGREVAIPGSEPKHIPYSHRMMASAYLLHLLAGRASVSASDSQADWSALNGRRLAYR